MDERELQGIVQDNSSNFRMIISEKAFPIDKIEIFQSDNPINEPTTRGGVYFAEMKEWKIHATFSDTSICSGESAQLNVTSNTAVASYGWNPSSSLNNSAISNPIVTKKC